MLGTVRTELVDAASSSSRGSTRRGAFEVLVVHDRADDVLADTERVASWAASTNQPIAEQVARTMADQGGMVLVTGEAGAGKSRLIRETCELARERGMAVLVGHCLDMDAPPPYQPLVEQLEHSARALTPEAFRELLGEQAPEVARLMPELHRIYDDIGESPVLPPDQERRYLLHGVGR